MVDEIDSTINNWVDKFLEEFCKQVVEEAKINLKTGGHSVSGKLIDSIRYEKVSNNEYKIVVDADYAAYIEYGTRAHIIRPKNKKALKFQVDGKDIFAKEVHHPGTSPYPYMEPAINSVIRMAEKKEL